MSETKLYDLGEKPGVLTSAKADRGPYYSSLSVNSKQIPELEDYELGEEVHFEIVAKITSVSKEEGKPQRVSLEMRKGRILNLTDKRKKALRLGISKKSLDEIDK